MVTNFNLTMAKDAGVPAYIGQAETATKLAETANEVARALSIVEFRGSVTFEAKNDKGTVAWTSVVTFTDDLPKGVWNSSYS